MLKYDEPLTFNVDKCVVAPKIVIGPLFNIAFDDKLYKSVNIVVAV